jgi:hypothetical protein
MDIGAQQQVIEAKSCITLPSRTFAVPEGVDALVRMEMADRVRPTPAEEPLEGGPAFRLYQCVVIPRGRRINVEVGWSRIVVACQYHWRAGGWNGSKAELADDLSRRMKIIGDHGGDASAHRLAADDEGPLAVELVDRGQVLRNEQIGVRRGFANTITSCRHVAKLEP